MNKTQWAWRSEGSCGRLLLCVTFPFRKLLSLLAGARLAWRACRLRLVWGFFSGCLTQSNLTNNTNLVTWAIRPTQKLCNVSGRTKSFGAQLTLKRSKQLQWFPRSKWQPSVSTQQQTVSRWPLLCIWVVSCSQRPSGQCWHRPAQTPAS